MFCFCLVFAMPLCTSVYMCLMVTCWERAGLLALVLWCLSEFITFPLVSWVRCGTCIDSRSLLPYLSRNSHRVRSPTHRRAIKEESKVANCDWVEHQAQACLSLR